MRLGIIAVSIAALVGCATGCAPSKSGGTNAAGSSRAQQAAGLGAPVRDGKFEFVVMSVDRSRTAGNPSNEFEQSTAQGEYINVHLSVKNIGNEAQSYFATNQKLIVGGKKFDAASIMGVNGDGGSLNPGLGVDTVVSFDVPVGTTPDSIELHDSAFSGGATVNLR
ncbi:DUF4352 domain-containing protein [Mycobacterium colombiense]|nr:DUF4352 domain-containing protein [Mycobacterium colombiense]